MIQELQNKFTAIFWESVDRFERKHGCTMFLNIEWDKIVLTKNLKVPRPRSKPKYLSGRKKRVTN